MKRDDLTGLAFGGNKTRLLEFVLGQAMERDPDVLVTGAGTQSNWCRQAAAAAAKLGLPIVLVLERTEMTEVQGNVLLDYWMGADVRFVEPQHGPDAGRHIDAMVSELRAQGRNVEKLNPFSGAAALGYVSMAAELDDQLENMHVMPTRLWLAASGSTLGGLMLGARLLGWTARITGIEPIAWPHASTPEIASEMANQAAVLLDVESRISSSDVDSRKDFIGTSDHVASRDVLDAMLRAARADAMLLDPSYTGKAMAALIAAVNTGELTSRDTVVFIHTGGLPAVFAYHDQLREFLNAPSSTADKATEI